MRVWALHRCGCSVSGPLAYADQVRFVHIFRDVHDKSEWMSERRLRTRWQGMNELFKKIFVNLN